MIMIGAELKEKTKDVRDVGDDDNSGPSSLLRDGVDQRDSGDGRAYARNCKEVEHLETEIYAAHATIGAALNSATRTPSRTVKTPCFFER